MSIKRLIHMFKREVCVGNPMRQWSLCRSIALLSSLNLPQLHLDGNPLSYIRKINEHTQYISIQQAQLLRAVCIRVK